MRHIFHALLFCIAAILITNCETTTASKDGITDNANPSEYGLYDIYMDEFGNKGIVAAVNTDESANANYIIVLSIDESNCKWGPDDFAVFPATDKFNTAYPSGFLFGLEMNQLVEEYGAELFPAFEWCHAKNRDRQPIHSSSWILPTSAELEMIFSMDTEALNNAVIAAGGTAISPDTTGQPFYWTATEDIEDYFHFTDDTTSDNYDQAGRAVPITSSALYPVHKERWAKWIEYRVRAIKYIYFRYNGELD